MHDTALQPGFGIDRLNCLGHPTEAVRTEQKNVQNTPAFEGIQHIQLGFTALMLSNPDAQYVLPTLHGMEINGYTRSSSRFCQATTSGIIFSLILVTSSGEISTS